MRTQINNQVFDEERALYHLQHADLTQVRFAGEADGESALKEAQDIHMSDCGFSLRYPLWHTKDFSLVHCAMDETARAALWYAENGTIEESRLYGIKAVRECRGILLTGCEIVSPEFGWKCDGLTLKATTLTAEYPFLDSRNLRLERVQLHGKYSFQYVENAVIEHCDLDTKDAFWHSRHVTVRDSIVRGEYLGWYAEGLTLERCRIIGTQPLCYCKDLTLIDCTMEACDLAFEYSDVHATVRGRIDSVKNPKSGTIEADAVGEIIRDDPVIPCSGKVLLRQS